MELRATAVKQPFQPLKTKVWSKFSRGYTLEERLAFLGLAGSIFGLEVEIKIHHGRRTQGSYNIGQLAMGKIQADAFCGFTRLRCL